MTVCVLSKMRATPYQNVFGHGVGEGTTHISRQHGVCWWSTHHADVRPISDTASMSWAVAISWIGGSVWFRTLPKTAGLACLPACVCTISAADGCVSYSTCPCTPPQTAGGVGEVRRAYNPCTVFVSICACAQCFLAPSIPAARSVCCVSLLVRGGGN